MKVWTLFASSVTPQPSVRSTSAPLFRHLLTFHFLHPGGSSTSHSTIPYTNTQIQIKIQIHIQMHLCSSVLPSPYFSLSSSRRIIHLNIILLLRHFWQPISVLPETGYDPSLKITMTLQNSIGCILTLVKTSQSAFVAFYPGTLYVGAFCCTQHCN